MKVAILGESSADEAAYRLLVDALLGIKTQPVANLSLRSRGWPAVFQVLPAVIKKLHYHTDAEALVVVLDSNHSPVHGTAHDSGTVDSECRWCRVQSILRMEMGRLRSVHGREMLKTAAGLAVPALEAWLRCGLDPHVSEAAWVQGLRVGKEPYTKNQLKEAVYGTSRPSLGLETRRATEEATRLSANLALLETPFPQGFGALAGGVRAW
jgi:hypothetical protein